ncbi:MAG: hypothetical protein JNL81_06125 [Hyphomonadaceae bacterium]|nr:hypothetical protein [Hyphomonadaceae bacterium]
MAEKQPLNATMFAFKKRERGGVLLGATLAYVVLAFAMFGIFAALNWQGARDYMMWITSFSQSYDPANPSSVAPPPASVMGLLPAYFLLLFFTYVLLASYEAACLRWMIRGETGGLFGLSLGADTWRVYAGYWMWFLLLIAAYIACAVIALVFMGSIFAVGSTGDANAMTSLGFAAPVLFLVILLGLLFFAVRLAPAAATSIARKKFAFFDAWTVTKGRFWALLGSFVLLWLMYVVAVIVLSVGIGVAVGMGAGGAYNPNATPEEAMDVFASPQVLAPVLVIYGLMIVAAFVWFLALFGINARAAQAALEEGKITVAS